MISYGTTNYAPAYNDDTGLSGKAILHETFFLKIGERA
tara:strand:+ start:390 stop:503 length:114 start_codon:yes stop_codon:yes gene_type:complete